MENPRPEKVAVVDEVRERFDGADAALLTEYRGLERRRDLAELRRALRAAGGEYKIYKNTLVRFAARDLGLDDSSDLLTGPTAIAFVDGDAVAVAKALRDFARTNPNLVVKGGLLGDQGARRRRRHAPWPTCRPARCCSPGSPAPSPPRCSSSPACSQALPRNFAYGLKALIDQQGGARRAEPRRAPEPTRPPQPEAAERRGARSRGPTPSARGRGSRRRSPPRRRAPSTETDAEPPPSRSTTRRSDRPWPPRKRSSTPSPA